MLAWWASKVLNFRDSESGNAATVFVLALIPAILVTGGTVDYGNVLSQRAKLQAAADAASVAASTPVDASSSARTTIATTVFSSNLAATSLASTVPQITVSGNSVRVQATIQVKTPFLDLAQIPQMAASADSTAVGTNTLINDNPGKLCLLALDPNSADGIHLQGANQVNYIDCWAHTNSTKGSAINAVGNNAKAVGKGHCAVGNWTETHQTFTPDPRAGCPSVNDPFATVGAYSTTTYTPKFTPPSKPDSCKSTNLSLKKGTFTLDPGRYCGGINIQAQATVNFNPGVYYIDNGILNVQSGSSVTGSNVLFYLGGANSSMTIIGGGTTNLSGRISGSSYEGFLVIQDPNSNRMGVSNIQGGGVFKLQGVIYMPTQQIEVAGNGDVNNATISFFGMVAKDFYFRGNGVFNAQKHTGTGNIPDIMPTMPTQQIRKAVVTN